MSDENSDQDYFEDVQESNKKKKGFVAALKGYIPMLLLSITLHLVLLFVISLIPAESSKDVEEKTIITVFDEKVEEEEKPEEIVKIELEVKEVQVEPVETAVAPTEEQVVEIVEDVSEVDDSLDELMDLLPENTQSTNDVSSLAVIGLSGGASGGSGLPTGYGNRSGKAKGKAVRKGGGDAKTEASVDAALQWLAEHQEADGSWDAKKYEGEVTDKGNITACALLPFLGAGHNEMAGKYRKTVRDGVNYLNELMRDEKVFKRPSFHNNYGSALVLMALSETSIFGSAPSTKKNANRIAEYFIEQYTDNPDQGWHYGKGGDDFSVSGWVALGLKSAKAADLPVMHTKDATDVFNKYKIWVDKVMTNPETGWGLYRPGHGGGSQHMGWVGMFQKQFLGFPRNDPFLKKASEKTVKAVNGGKWIGEDKPGAVYGIYYGTLASFQQQGEAWDAWNPAMKKTLVNSQRVGNPKEMGGSWDPTSDHTAQKGGRVMTTALFALCLEVYYRYDMMQ